PRPLWRKPDLVGVDPGAKAKTIQGGNGSTGTFKDIETQPASCKCPGGDFSMKGHIVGFVKCGVLVAHAVHCHQRVHCSDDIGGFRQPAKRHLSRMFALEKILEILEVTPQFLVQSAMVTIPLF